MSGNADIMYCKHLIHTYTLHTQLWWNGALWANCGSMNYRLLIILEINWWWFKRLKPQWAHNTNLHNYLARTMLTHYSRLHLCWMKMTWELKGEQQPLLILFASSWNNSKMMWFSCYTCLFIVAVFLKPWKVTFPLTLHLRDPTQDLSQTRCKLYSVKSDLNVPTISSDHMLGRHVIITGANVFLEARQRVWTAIPGKNGMYCIATIFDHSCSLIGNASCCCQRCSLFIRIRSGLPVFGMVIFWSNYSLVCADWICLFFWKVIYVCLVWEGFPFGCITLMRQRVSACSNRKQPCIKGAVFRASVKRWNMIEKRSFWVIDPRVCGAKNCTDFTAMNQQSLYASLWCLRGKQ